MGGGQVGSSLYAGSCQFRDLSPALATNQQQRLNGESSAFQLQLEHPQLMQQELFLTAEKDPVDKARSTATNTMNYRFT
ncbi:hypothetical protein GCM10011383_43860 [Hymenobacter cavernae]|uniref:Uncharacterized protein n=1 Tax=Hymenobacter cavernae TaxID=2044852 RepID=A0ABQ1UUF7_9BACT|nr:hypothetical protein GCM10011383_43860 [Hymenobacter cavernae]